MNKKRSNPAKFSGLVTVSEKGQIAIPKSVRDELNIKTGDRLTVVIRKDASLNRASQWIR